MANFVSPFENWVAEGIASDVNDFTVQSRFSDTFGLRKNCH